MKKIGSVEYTPNIEGASRQLERLLYKTPATQGRIVKILRSKGIYNMGNGFLEDFIQDIYVIIQNRIVRDELGILPDSYYLQAINYAIGDVLSRRTDRALAKGRTIEGSKIELDTVYENFAPQCRNTNEMFSSLINSIAIEQAIGHNPRWVQTVREKTGQMELDPEVSFSTRANRIEYARKHLEEVLL